MPAPGLLTTAHASHVCSTQSKVENGDKTLTPCFAHCRVASYNVVLFIEISHFQAENTKITRIASTFPRERRVKVDYGMFH